MRKLQMHWTQHPDKRRGLYRFDAETNQVEVLDREYKYSDDFKFVMEARPAGGPFPGLRSPWYDEQCGRKGNMRAVAMDLDINPQGSAAQFFNPVMIAHHKGKFACLPSWEGDIGYDKDTGRPIQLRARKGGALKLWLIPIDERQVPEGRYGAGADLSAGTGATNSCLSIISADKHEKVLEYCTASMGPENLAPLFTALCWLFKDRWGNPALFAWECAGPGVGFGKRVLEMGYPHLYWREGGVPRMDKTTSTIPGWSPTPENKRQLLESYDLGLQRDLVNHSELALKECLEYRWTATATVEHPHDTMHDDPTRARSNHGDRVIADALAWKMVLQLGLKRPEEKQAEAAPVGSLAWRKLLAREREEDHDDD